jgi:4'-phosphopantetheinyl transferase
MHAPGSHCRDAAFELADRQVHVWPVTLEAPDAVVERYRGLLNADERARAARFHFDKLRRSFTLARGALRVLLGRYRKVAAGEIQFRYGARGKPALAAASRLHFNASHSGTLALFAFTLDCEIGVDVEHVRPRSAMEDIAQRFFSADETAALMALSEQERGRAFFDCWTRKEAYIKATGDGLAAPLDSFSVSLDPAECARFVRLPDGAPADSWSLNGLTVDPRYAAAVAYPGASRTLEVRPVTEPGALLDPL